VNIMLYAIRDRMLDYYQRPVFSDRKSDFVAAVANAINTGGTNDFCQTPEHFEIWELGSFNVETGQLEGKQTIITNCASLVRNGVRHERTSPPAATPRAPGQSTGAPRHAPRDGGTEARPVPQPVPGASSNAQAPRQEPDGGNQLHPHHRED